MAILPNNNDEPWYEGILLLGAVGIIVAGVWVIDKAMRVFRWFT